MHGISQCFYMFIVFENIMFYTICQAPSQNCLKISKTIVLLRHFVKLFYALIAQRILVECARGF